MEGGDQGVLFNWFLNPRPCLPPEVFLEVTLETPSRTMVIGECTFRVADCQQNRNYIFQTLIIQSPFLPFREFKAGDKVELILRTFLDDSRTSLIGEHHQSITYEFSSEYLHQHGLRSSLGLDREKQQQQDNNHPSSPWKTSLH